MNNPTNLLYTKTHEWVEFTSETTAKIGLTDFAQQSLGGIVFVNLPEEGDGLEAGAALGDVESVKAVSDIISPVSGTVTGVNQVPLDSPESVNETPYETWLVEASDITQRGELMDAGAYEAFCKENE